MARKLPNVRWNISAVANSVNEINKQAAFMKKGTAAVPTVLSTKSIGSSFDEIRELSGINVPNVVATQSSVNNALTYIDDYIEANIPELPEGARYETYLPLQTDRYGLYGSADATLQRASEATVVDHEGIVRLCQNDEFRFTGARREEELANNDFSEWVGTTGGAITPDGVVTFDGTSITESVYGRVTSVDGTNQEFTSAIEIKASGEHIGKTVNLNLSGNGPNYSHADVGRQDIVLTGDWQLVSAVGMSRYGADWSNGVRQVVRQNLAIPEPVVFQIRGARFKLVTNQSNQAPSEFITPNDSACSERDIAVRYFPYENGNSVDANGVVTEARGADIDPAIMKRLLVEEEGTNNCEYSNNINDGAYWAAINATIHDYESFTPTAADGRVYFVYGSYTPSVDVTLSFKIKSEGNTALEVRHFNSASGNQTSITASTEWEYKTLAIQAPVSGGFSIGIQDPNVAGFGKISIKDFNATTAAYPLSHIPTSSGSATRLADDCQTVWPAGLVNDFVVSCLASQPSDNTENHHYWRSDTTAAYGTRRYTPLGAKPQFYGAGGSAYGTITPVADVLYKLQSRKSATTGMALFVDSVKAGEDLAITVDYSANTELNIGWDTRGNERLNGNIGDIAVVSGDLTDEEVIDL